MIVCIRGVFLVCSLGVVRVCWNKLNHIMLLYECNVVCFISYDLEVSVFGVCYQIIFSGLMVLV